jgi:MFS family permease
MPISKEQKNFWSPFKIASIIGAIIIWLIGDYFSDKIENWRNDMIDNLLANYQETFWGWVFASPYNLMQALAVLVFIIICVDAYFFYKKRLGKQKSEVNKTSVFVTNESMQVES